MRRLVTVCLLALSAAALVAAAPAAAKKRAARASTPSITRVTPMRISVGNPLTIKGHNFKPQRSRNTIIFRGPNGRTAFAKPRRASRTKLVLVVPAAAGRLLTVGAGGQRPTRLSMRVLAGKFSKFTSRRLSPVVTALGAGDGGPGGGGGGTGGGTNVCPDDNDLLEKDLELQIGTDPCIGDTDKDSMADGWEYWSARDLNVKAVPYPGKRPFPNALDPSDGGSGSSAYDFDGDGLTTVEEYRAWAYAGGSFAAEKAGVPDLESPLGYSDGTKFSRAGETPSSATHDLHGDGAWRDDERDADGDALANWIESARGPGKPQWWEGYFSQAATQAEPWPKQTCGQEFGAYSQHPFAELDLADGDVDGDGLVDGWDDQDNDGWSNTSELYEVVFDLDGDGQRACGLRFYPSVDVDPGPAVDSWVINAFNPCAPDPNSRTCDDYRPFG
jgi:IPT/TIG domain